MPKPLRETVLARRVVKLVEALDEVPTGTLKAMAEDFRAHGTDSDGGDEVDELTVKVLECVLFAKGDT
jgi:hypothetical protein